MLSIVSYFKNQIYYFKNLLKGREIIQLVQHRIPVNLFGNEGAGFYVVTKKLDANSIVYSFGLGKDISFDLQLINKYNCKVYGFDPTPDSIKYIKSLNLPENFYLNEYGLSNADGNLQFFLPKNPDHISGTLINRWGYNKNDTHLVSVPVKKFQSILNEFQHNKIDILKLDIEGAEYDIIDDVIDSKIEIKQILIEFHHRFKEISPNKTREAIKKLNAASYKIVAISKNKEEYSFLKI